MKVPGFWKWVASAGPGPIVALANEWFGLFGKLTIFSNPNWQEVGDNSALAVGAVAVGVCSAVWQKTDKQQLRERAVFFFVVFVGLAVVCAVIYGVLNFPVPRVVADLLNLLWLLLYVVMLVSLLMAIMTATLYGLAEAPPAAGGRVTPQDGSDGRGQPPAGRDSLGEDGSGE